MLSNEALRKMRSGNNNNNTNTNAFQSRGIMPKGQGYPYGPFAKNQMYPNGNHLTQPAYDTRKLNNLTHGSRGMSLQTPAFGSNRPGLSMPPQTSPAAGVPVTNGIPYLYDGQFIYANPPYQNSGHSMYSGQSFLGQNGYNGYQSHYSDNSPSFQTSRNASAEVPSLITPRRGSSSSNENDLPGTPFNHYPAFGDVRPGVAVLDHSPNSLYSWSTSSPSQVRFMGKQSPPAQIPLQLQLLCQQDPPIPPAVPAPFSPTKPLDRRLENPNGITNVYIRGLQPNTTDEKLLALASRFGEIVSSKAIIDHQTKHCKGFGFVKYHNFKDAENCIRGFHFCGYETSFARESFYCQLKKLSAEDNTNLYVSNLPKDMNEHELAGIFVPYKVCSSRVLRNGDGSGRGVGFARFESREVCEGVIKDFNNTPVAKPDGEEHIIQIRYADTPEQKALKLQTTAARQYRTAEYESQTQSPPHYGTAAALASGVNPYDNMPVGSESEFEQYMANQHGYGSPQANPYGNNASGRLSALTGQLTPNSSAPSINVSLPNGSQHTLSNGHKIPNDEDDKTITATIASPGNHDKVAGGVKPASSD